MNFEHTDLLQALANERRQQIMAAAAERRLLRQARLSHPSGKRRLTRFFRAGVR